MISLIDYITAAFVVFSVALRFKYRWVWFMYSIACYTYVGIGISSGLLGLAVLNVLVGTIALWNAITFTKPPNK
jgi:hypothetical protein